MAKHAMGWKPQLPDARDRHFTALREATLPPLVDWRVVCPAVYDQGAYGSCTANAAVGAFEFDVIKQGVLDTMPSRMFAYYNTRVLDGDVRSDGGGTIRNANKALAKWGVCPESEWPYVEKDLLTKAPDTAYIDAAPNMITNYAAVQQDLDSIKTVLANGFPVQIGFTVYESFESDAANTTGIIPMPDLATEGVLGGHAVLIVGYADSITVGGGTISNVFITRNSWGTSWGDKGYFYMPYPYFTDANLASDLWVINAVPGPKPGPNPPPPVPSTSGILLTDSFLNSQGYYHK